MAENEVRVVTNNDRFITGGCVQTFPTYKTTGVTKHRRVTEETLDSNGKVTKRVITEEWEYPGSTGPWNPPYQPVWISRTTQSSDTAQLWNNSDEYSAPHDVLDMD